MKKLLLILLVAVAVLIVCVYVSIPNVIPVDHSVFVKASRDGLTRKLLNEKKWNQWWPGTTQKGSGEFMYNNLKFSVNEKRINAILISVGNDRISANTLLNIIPKNNDTTQLIWAGGIPTSYNPIKRLQIYFGSKYINNEIDSVLKIIQAHFSKTENVYDYKIKEESVVDSFFISTYAIANNYPSTAFIYTQIDQLKKYITSHQAKETGFPMLNVSTTDSIHFLTRVAIPVDRTLPSSGTILLKQMPVGGNILVVDVKGGPASVYKALHEMADYITDHHMSAPAIPYFSLITDRRQEPDTSKWQTRIYYPVM